MQARGDDLAGMSDRFGLGRLRKNIGEGRIFDDALAGLGSLVRV